MKNVFCDICKDSGGVLTGEDMGVPIYSTCTCMSQCNNEHLLSKKLPESFCFEFISSDNCKKIIEYFNYNPYSPVYFKGKEGYYYGLLKGIPKFAEHPFSDILTSEKAISMLSKK